MPAHTKFDAKKAEQICGGLAEGLFLSDAAAMVGVASRTVEIWIEKGKKAESGPLHDFALSVASARAQFVVLTTRAILRDGDRDKTSSMRWLLSKLQPIKFGDRVQVHVTTAIEEKLEALREAFPPETYARIVEVLAGESRSTGA